MPALTARRAAVLVVQYGVGVLAFAWLLGQVDVARLGALLRTIDPATVLELLAVTAVGLLARFSTWNALVGSTSRPDLRAAAGIDLVVNFVNQLLPSRLSGRAAAPLVVRERTGLPYPEAVAVAGVHTGLYALCYGVVALAGVVLGVGRLSTGMLLLLALATALYLLAGAFVLLAGANLGVAERLVAWVRAVAGRVPAVGDRLADRADSLPSFAGATAERFRTLAADPRVLFAYVGGFAVAMVLAPGLRVFLLLSALGPGFQPAWTLPFYLLAAYSVTLLPLTPGGVGVTEATATAVFVGLGVPAAVIVPVVFVDRVLGVYLPALAGWYPSVRLDVAGLVAE